MPWGIMGSESETERKPEVPASTRDEALFHCTTRSGVPRGPYQLNSGVISPLISSSILGTYWPGEFLFQYPIILPFHTVHGFSRQEYWSGLPFPSLGDLLDPGIKSTSPVSSILAGRFFYHQPTGKPLEWAVGGGIHFLLQLTNKPKGGMERRRCSGEGQGVDETGNPPIRCILLCSRFQTAQAWLSVHLTC